MNYINIEKKKIKGRNNQNVDPLIIDYSTLTDESFTFIDSNNKIVSVPESAGGYYFAGSLKMGQPASSLLWLCRDYEISGDVLTFKDLDTYTSGYLESIKKKYTEVNIEIGIQTNDVKQVLLRDIRICLSSCLCRWT